MIKNTILLLLLICGFTMNVTAQETNSLLWKISGNHVKSDSYILFSTSGVCDLSPVLLSKLSAIANNVKVYYTETALGNKKYDSLSQKFMMIKDQEEPINKLLPAKVYQALKIKMADRKMDEKVLNQLTALVIYNLLLADASPECKIPNYVETALKTYADKYGIEVKELLSTQEAFDFLNSYGNAYYINEIEDLLNNDSAIKQDLLSKSALYSAENITGLKELFTKSRFLNSKFSNEAITGNRIKEVADKMMPVITEGGVLITLDLVNIIDSKNNILNELKKRGYVLTTLAD